MKFANWLDVFAYAFSLASSFLLVFLAICGDGLFFNSMLILQIQFLASVALMVSLPLSVGVVFSSFLRRTDLEGALTKLEQALAFCIFFGGFLLLSDQVFSEQTLTGFFIKVSIILAAAAGATFSAYKGKENQRSLHWPSRILTVIFLCFGAVPYLRGIGTDDLGTKNLVLLVIDGLSHEDLPILGAAEVPGFSQVTERATIYTEARTNYAYTHGYFQTLFSGNLDGGNLQKKNLLERLQQAGVSTRWVVSHNNANPDSHGLRYDGLRSTFITEHTAPFFRALGIQYNVFKTRGNADLRGKSLNQREKWTRVAVAKLANFLGQPTWLNYTLAEIEYSLSRGQPFFLLLHSFPALESSDEENDSLWLNADVSASELKKRKQGWKKNDYRYPARDVEYVELFRAQRKQSIALGMRSLAKLVQEFENRGWFKDTTLIVTADHGATMEDGRIWYRYHPVEGVDKVPMLVFPEGPIARDERLIDTQDLSKGILNFFNSNGSSASEHSDFFSDQRKVAVTFHSLSFLHKECYLSIYSANGTKAVLNLFGSGDARVESSTVAGLSQSTIPAADSIKELSETLAQIPDAVEICGHKGTTAKNLIKKSLTKASL